MQKFMLFVVAICLHLSAFSQKNAITGKLAVTVHHKGKVVACNVRIKDAEGNYHRPDSSSVWKDFNGHVFEEFPCNGLFEMELPYGQYSYEVDRGPAYNLIKGNFAIDQKVKKMQWQLQEIVDLKKRNWYAGETHIHRKYEDMKLLMKATDLHVGEVITSWNDNSGKNSPDTAAALHQFDGDRFFDASASEDERGGGALLFFNLDKPHDFGNQQTEYPPLSASINKVMAKNKGAWVDLEKPFWPDVPILLATGKVSSIGIANNHMLKTGIFDNEAWGKKRDTLQYPSPLGNAYWTQDIYYHILNAGFHIPPSAGSASGVLWNPVGYNRLYAYVKGDLTYAKWWEAVKKGNCFVSNGPLLLCNANGELPGYVFKQDSGKSIAISINAELYSRDAVTAIEIIKNGKVSATIKPDDIKNNKLTAAINFEESGWFLVRVLSTVNNNFRFASTAPFYVEVGADQKHISKASCRFFLQWLAERETSLQISNEVQRTEVFNFINNARTFWENLLANATAE